MPAGSGNRSLESPMRFIRNLLLTIICIAAIGAAVIFGYYRFRGNRERGLLNEGLAQIEQGNYRLARDKFAEAQSYENQITRYLSSDSLEEDLYRYSAICDFRLGDIDAASSIYDRLLRIHPKDASLMESRATCYAAQGQMEEAVDLFDTAIAIDKSNYQRIYTAAVTLREYGDDKTGLKYFEELLKDHEAELDDLTRGEALCFLGQYKEAAEILSRVENPGMETVFLLACAKEYTGAHEEALDLLKDYTEEIAFNPEMLNLRGTALCATGEYKEALACFEQALPLSQEGTALQRSSMFNRIAAVENLRDFDRAKELAAQYAEKYPKDERMKRENQFLQTR